VTGGMIRQFIGEPADGSDDSSLVRFADMLSDRLPEGCLAIADCNFSDQVVLKFDERGTEFAGVWFWDSDAFWVSEDTPALHWLADSFHGFLSMLFYDVCAYEEEIESLPLFQAVERGNFLAVKQYLGQGGALETRNAAGRTLLAAAVIHAWPRIVRLLLEHSADPNARDQLGRTPLHHAAEHSVDSVKLLLAAGADAKARDDEGKSVLAQWSYKADQLLRANGAEE
jgi:hypothetical protein